MFIVPQNAEKEVAVLNCVQRFFSSLKVGQLLKQCNGTKEKGVSAVPDLLKNTFYHFLNSTKTNWLRFTSMLASEIINNEFSNLTAEKRANVFIVDDTLFNRTSCKKTELGSESLIMLK